MGAGRLRRLLLPVLMTGVAALAVRGAAQLPDERPDPAVAPSPVPLGELWAAWGSDLSPDGAYPAALTSLNDAEALYLLLTVRAAQVAEAVDRATPGTPLDEAVRDAGLDPQPELVSATAVPGRPGCVVLDYADEPFGRVYFGWADAPDEPGPSPGSPLEEVLLRTARVGLPGADAATCGAGVAYSPAGQQALRALTPELLVTTAPPAAG